MALGSESLNRRRLLARLGRAGAWVAASALLNACQVWPRPPTIAYRPPTPSPTPHPLALSIGLPSQPMVDLLPLLSLPESEPARSRGLQIRLVWSQAGQDALALLLAGRVQLALLDVPTAARALDSRVDLVGVFQVYAQDPSTVFALARSGLSGVADLQARPIGLPEPGGAPAAALLAALRTVGLDLSAVERLVESDPRELLASGQAIALSASGHLIPWFESRSLPVVRLASGDWSRMPGPGLCLLRGNVPDSRRALTALTAALQAHVLALSGDLLRLQAAAAQSFSVDAEQRPAFLAQVASVQKSLSDFPVARGPGWADPDRYDGAEAVLRDLGIISGAADFSQVFINDFLPT